ncbi:MAG: right-handed parallel beta-helix repeat-containing protein [Deltaproteobacteria bacterium]|nr:right-handed parallel beta-helix repeat-containing protein [Deltaproteobacteria bacterium]
MHRHNLFPAAGALLFILNLLVTASWVWSAPPPDVYYVSPSGIDSGSRDGSASEPWRTIGYAIGRAEAGAGDVIMVQGDADDNNDDYVENVTVDKNVKIHADESSLTRPTVKANNPSEEVFRVTANNVEIKGLSIYGTEAEGRAGIMLNAVSECLLEDNSVGLHPSKRNYIGIMVEGGHHNVIQGNSVRHNNYGMGFLDTWANVVYYNAVELNKKGMAYRSSISGGIIANLIIGNTIRLNTDAGYGVGLELVSDEPWSQNVISGNRIEKNDTGIFLYDSPRGILTFNDLLDNTTALGVYRYTGYMDIFRNYFSSHTNIYCVESDLTLGSSAPLFYNFSGRYFKSFLGNFYSDYTSSDTNEDGIGDTAYSGSGYLDDRPLVEPLTLYGWNLVPKEDGSVALDKGDYDGPGKVVTLLAHSSKVLSSAHPYDDFTVLFTGGNTAEQTTWNGWLTFASPPAADHSVSLTLGSSKGYPSSFEPSSASADISGDGTHCIIFFTASPGVFRVPMGRHLAVRLENMGDTDLQIMVGGAACMFFAPAGSRPVVPLQHIFLLLDQS